MTCFTNVLLCCVVVIALAACSKDTPQPPNAQHSALDLHALEDQQRAVVIDKRHGLSEEHYVVGDEIVVLHRRKHSSILKDRLELLKKMSIDDYVIDLQFKTYSHSAFIEEIKNAISILKIAARPLDVIKICNRGRNILRYHPAETNVCAQAMVSGGFECEAILFHHKIKDPLADSSALDQVLKQSGKSVADCAQDRVQHIRVQLQNGATESEIKELEDVIVSLCVTMPGSSADLCEDYMHIIPHGRLYHCGVLMVLTGRECESLPFYEKAGDLRKMKETQERYQCP